MWGDSKARSTSKRKKKEKTLSSHSREMSSVSSTSAIDPDLSAAVQGTLQPYTLYIYIYILRIILYG